MFDPVGTSARATAEQLSPHYGPKLSIDVEVALQERENSSGSERFFVDPISLASLIVSIASFAWTVYNDLRKKKTEPSADDLTKTIRIEFADSKVADPAVRDQVAKVVATELVKAAGSAS
jgi:hypothetical protein